MAFFSIPFMEHFCCKNIFFVAKLIDIGQLPHFLKFHYISPVEVHLYHLVGGWATPLKNMKVNWDDYSQYMGK